MKQTLKKLLIILTLIIIVSAPVSIARLHDIAKNYIYMSNYDAKSILKCIMSDNYRFFDYCVENNIPEQGTVYISGQTTSYYDLIIDANEYCNQRKNISIKITPEQTIDFYWTVKIEDNKISEIWTCNIPLTQEQLKPYTFDEQIEMMPLLKKDKFNYAIGYYNAKEE